MLVLLLAVVAGIAFIKWRQIQGAMSHHFTMPPAAVTTLRATAETWQPVLRSVGSLRAVQGVEVSTDLAGIVREIAFESGANVKQGDLLVKLDTRQEEAQLRAAEAALELARLNLERQRDLLAKRATSRSEFDAASATADQAQAAVDQIKALIARKTLRAPFDGVLGIRKVDVGEYLDVGKPVASLESRDPIYVEFSVPQQDLPSVAPGRKVRLKATGIAGREFEGEITAINAKVDEATRNLLVQATIPNPDGVLRSGMFVEAEVLQPEREAVIAVPATAILYAPYGDSVYLVKDSAESASGKQAIQQFVKLGSTRGDQVAILSGVKEGDEVVTSGGFKLNSGAAVKVDNSIVPANAIHPKPPET